MKHSIKQHSLNKLRKILYIITATAWGGAPLYVFQLMECVVKQGHEVGLVAASEPRLMQEVQCLGIQIKSSLWNQKKW